MLKKIKMRIKQFKELENKDKLIIALLLCLMVRLSWPLLQIIYTVVCNIIELHG